ncbi:MAG TPA: flagellin [Acidiferrobacterales bacterium]|nr:flagellin [Acidiferrobacterales bacterium]
MAQIINTNIASLNAQRNLNTSQTALSVSLQRLSSGLRINSAKDDAAGLGISDRMTTQIRGLNQAVRNSQDGVSLSQTSESALAEISNNLQRIRELAVQSANATNSSSDRAALDLEVQQRIAEVDRIATQTSFNGRKVLDGSFGTAAFQVGANVGETISVNLSTGTRSTQIGQIATGTSSVEVTTTALGGTGTIVVGSNAATTIGASTQGTAAGQSVGSAYSKAAAINAAGVPGLSTTATNNIELVVANVTSAGGAGTYSLTINGRDVYSAAVVSATITSQQVADAINAQTANTGVTASLSGTDLRLSAADGRDINIGQTVAGDTAGGITDGAGGATTVNGVVYRDGTVGTAANATAYSTNAAAVNGGTLTLTASENIVVTADGANLGFAAAGFTLTRDTTTIASSNVLTVAAANNAITRVDSALTSVSNLRSTFGAIQNRFDSVIANLEAVSENLTASRSRILDADFAQETAALTRGQILQQAGVAILAQANSLPQNVLALLR